MRLIRHLTRRLRQQDGFTMPAVLLGMLVVMLISVAAIAAANGDTNLTRYDQNDKQAYAAAEAGVNDYLGHLNVDNNYWANCTNVGAPSPVNQLGTVGAARKWRTLPGTGSEYSIELVPAPGYSACSTTNATASMVNDGNIKIRVTGHVLRTNNYRTINATFRRAGFLDYLYYTKFENQDPAYIQRTIYAQADSTFATDSAGNPTGGPDLKTWEPGACNQYYYGANGRPTQKWTGKGRTGSYTSPVFSVGTDDVCGEIQFVTGDSINGPFHSNDDILICGTPSFGSSNNSDRVEVSGPGQNGNGYRTACSGTNPTFNPSLISKAGTFEAPATNSSLKDLADDPYTFTGPTDITFNGNSMTIKNPNVNGGAAKVMAFPDSGVIYVANGACGAGYDPTNSEATFAAGNTCGDVHLSGTYSKDLTIAAENDIVITGNVKKTSGTDALLGLIPNGFARIWHPVTNGNGSSCTNASNSPNNVQVDAAILTLSGSFTVDNYWCGAALGNLTVNGAIAQTHRGVVGTGGGGGGNTGYLKNYNYNDTLRYRSPPHFLDPLQSSWRILRQGEQSPPARG
jgi:hypothetical protein